MKALVLAAALNIFIATPMWAQQQKPDANLVAQLDKMLAESDSKARGLTGAPKQKWLLRHAKIEKIIDRLKAGQSVDPRDIDVILKGVD
jgi:7,8-dihydro-6-hydroxymethylpterin-pyrophosphokinase